jgi:hypothetical protein
LYGGFHRHQLPHQLIVNVETPAGVQHDEIIPLVPSAPPARQTDDIGLDSLCLIDKYTSIARSLLPNSSN